MVMLLAFLPVSAQQSFDYEVISTEQGLSQGMVFTMFQDKEGFLWFATKDGLNRYDGFSFKVFTNDPNNPRSISNNSVRIIYEDSKGRLWLGLENNGLNVYDKKTGYFHPIRYTDNNTLALSSNRVKQLTETPDGKFLVSNNDAGLDVLTVPSDFFENNTSLKVDWLQLPDKAQVVDMFIDRKDRIWIRSSNNILYRFETKTNSFTKIREDFKYDMSIANEDGSVWCSPGPVLWDGHSFLPMFDHTYSVNENISRHQNNNIWFTIDKRLRAFDYSAWRPGKPLSAPKSWVYDSPSLGINVSDFDRSGNVWIGTDGYGLRKITAGRLSIKHLSPGFSVRHLLPLGNDDFLLSAYPVEWRRLKNGSMDKNPFYGLGPGVEVDGALISKTGLIYAWTNRGPVSFDPTTKTVRKFPWIEGYGDKQPMFEDSKGYIWFAGFLSTLARLEPTSGKLANFIFADTAAHGQLPLWSTAIHEDVKGVLWLGTELGFARAEPQNEERSLMKFKWFGNVPGKTNGLNYKYVSYIVDDPVQPERFLWICTKGGGLNRMDKISGDFIHITKANGLPDNVVYGILFDEAGNMWGSTNRGIFCLNYKGYDLTNPEDLSNLVIRKFTKSDGLQDDEFNTGAFAKLPNGKLAFGGINGLNIFDPKELLKADFQPPVYITNILINNQPVAPGDETGILTNTIETTKHITLSPDQDILTLEFSALDFTNPKQNKYRYQLAGIEDDWVESGTRRSATFLHLPSGDYTFRVQGSNSQGIWSEHIAELRITVLPPWWRSWWAYLGYLLLLAVGIRQYLRFTVNRAKLKEQLAYETRESERVRELDAIKTQLYTNITHEFRTPLTVILGMAHQALEKPGDHFRSGLEMIIRNGQSLLNLVNEMLDLSKLDSGKMSLHQVSGEVISFLRYLVEAFHSLADSQDKHLYFHSNTDALHVAFDPEKLRQIVANLLSNALKFTPEGGDIHFLISVQSPKAGDFTNLSASTSGFQNLSNLVIRVKDTGIGIPEESLDNVFERFYQVEGKSTRQGEGTGIGLALTKELVKLMGGEISVKSPPEDAETGSEFKVILPLKHCAETPQIIPNLTVFPPVNGLPYYLVGNESEVNKEMPLLLLVEDNPDVVAYTASCLTDYRLIVGKNGQEGLDLATERIPDLIISDVMMPVMDGFELCQRLRTDERTSHIPIILLTAKSDMESKLQGLERGADAYLSKPFHKQELLVRIKMLLEMRRQLQLAYLKSAGLTLPAMDEGALVLPEKTENAFVQKVREIIEANYQTPNFNVEQLSKEVFLSESQLQRKLDAMTGISPIRFIRIIRLNKSKELLENKDLAISTVAAECGFNDAGYFARVFKQEFGMTPLEWQKK